MDAALRNLRTSRDAFDVMFKSMAVVLKTCVARSRVRYACASSGRLSLPGCGGCERHVEPHDVRLDAGRVGLDARMCIRRTLDGAGCQIHLPGVQRAYDRVAGNDAVAQRSSAVRTLVVDGQKAIPEIEDGDFAITD